MSKDPVEGKQVAKEREYSEEEQSLISKYQERIKLRPPKVKEVEMVDGVRHVGIEEADSVIFRAKMMEATGTVSVGLSNKFVGQIIDAIPQRDDSRLKDDMSDAFFLMNGIKPTDEVESMLAVQMICTHNLAMEFLRRSAFSNRDIDLVDGDINKATKLLRTYTAQIEALNRYRMKGQQKVTVEHVNVNEGGQAIVGIVDHKSGGSGGQ